MKPKGLLTYLFSAAGVAAMFVILIAFNWIASRGKVRIDLTEEKAYTLSDGTKKILGKLDSTVQIRFYASRQENRMPIPFKLFAQRIEDLLEEFREKSNGHIDVQKLDPVPDSAAEDSAKMDGLVPLPLPEGDNVYLGLSVDLAEEKEVISLIEFTPERLLKREQLIEYELARAISRVMSKKPTIGLMSALPVTGGMSPDMMRGGRGTPQWALYSELKMTFNITRVELTAEKIPDDVNVLVVIHPKGISEVTQYAIDQFVLRGGKLLACLDPLAALDAQAGGPMGRGISTSSMDRLLKGWGLSFDSTKLVADTNYITRTREGRNPTVLSLNDQAVDPKDVLTAGTDSLFMVFAGAFSGTPTAGLTETVLVKSSKNAQLVDAMSAQAGGERLLQDFSASGVEYPLAIRLTGKFKTAFPEGKPKAAEAPKPGEEKPPEPPAGPSLKESATENGSVILVGDSDFLQDQLAVDVAMNPLTGQAMTQIRNGNIPFAQAAIEQMAGDENLIKVRSRATRERPFTVVNEMRQKAEDRGKTKIKEFETQKAEADRKLIALLQSKAGERSQRIVLTPEQIQERDNLRQKLADVNKSLKEEKKNLRSDVDSLQNRLIAFNLAAVPIVVILAGVVMAIRRRWKQAAV